MIAKYETVLILIFLFVNGVATACTGEGNISSCALIANASFTNDYVLINIEFTSPVQSAQSFIGCSSIFRNSTVVKLGNGSICSFTDHGNINVYPDIFGSIKVGDSLLFKADSVRYTNGTPTNIGSLIINRPGDTSLEPVPVVTEHGYLSKCTKDRFMLSADLSYNSGYKPFVKYDWALNIIVGNISGETLGANNYLVNKPDNASEIEVTNQVLSSNRSIHLNISNVFGSSGNTTIQLTESLKPNARILGKRDVTIPENVEHYFHGDLTFTKCGPLPTRINYNWSISQIGGSSENLLEHPSTRKSLHIKPFMLSNNESYEVSVSIAYEMSDNTTGVALASTNLFIQKVPLKPNIIGGNRDIGMNQTLWVHGEELSGRKGAIRFTWHCRDATSREPCRTRSEAILTFGNTTVISLPLNTVKIMPGKRYQFILTVLESSEEASASIFVNIKGSPVPDVSIISLCSYCSSHEDIFWRGIIRSNQVNASIKYSWSIHEYGRHISLHASNGHLNTDHMNGSIPFIVFFEIPKNTLENGKFYKVALNATIMYRSSESTWVLKTPIFPRYGKLVVEPRSGTSFNTTFRLRTYGWVEQSNGKPLHFRFGYKVASKVRLLTEWQSSNVLQETLLPHGETDNGNKISVFVEIKDSKGIVNMKEVEHKCDLQEINDYQHLVRYFEQRLAAKDFGAVSIGILGILSSNLSTEMKREHFEVYLGAIENIQHLQSLNAILIDSIDDLVTLLKRNRVMLTHELKERIAKVTIKLAKSLEDTMTGQSSLLLQALFTIYDGILPPREMVFPNTTGTLQAFRNTTKILSGLLCRSVPSSRQLRRLNISISTVSAGFEDLSMELSTNSQLSLSKDFRGSYIVNNCLGANHLECAGICWSVVSYNETQYFYESKDVGDILTGIHQARLMDLKTKRYLKDSTNGRDFQLTIPIMKQYNNTIYTIKVDHKPHFSTFIRAKVEGIKTGSYLQSCIMYDPIMMAWNDSLCHSEVLYSSMTLRCSCSRLYAVAGIKVARPAITTITTLSVTTTSQPKVSTTTTIPASTPIPRDVIVLVMDANCTKYTADRLSKDKFVDDVKTSLADKLKISKSRITIWSLQCGSVIVNLTISDSNASQSAEPTKLAAMMELQTSLASGLLRVSLSDGSQLGAAAPGVQIQTILPSKEAPTTKPFIPNVTTNWVPMMASFAIILTILIAVTAFIAWLHGRYYKKKRFTDINTIKEKPKVPVEDPIETMSRRQRNKKLHSIMDESLENAEVPAIIVAAPMSLKRTKRKPKINPISGAISPQNSVASSRTTMRFSTRDLPRLALDETSSESEAETSFTEGYARPRTAQSRKTVISTEDAQYNSRTELKKADLLSPKTIKSASSVNERPESRQSSSSSDE